jgi:hypothetical protein
MKIYFGIFVKSFDAQEVQEAMSSGATSEKNQKNDKTSKEDPGPGSLMDPGSSIGFTAFRLIQVHA